MLRLKIFSIYKSLLKRVSPLKAGEQGKGKEEFL
jgi:hypothetical protein